MNQSGITPSGRYKGVDYFNGGLFSSIHPIELTREELNFLDTCARENWNQIRPSIFGNIFEGAIDPKQRHTYGIHFTSEADIRQIVRPNISDYWKEKIESASTIKELNYLRLELQSYRVLDADCGCGNFLYVAYQELKRLENKLIEKVAKRSKIPSKQMEMGFVTPLQFYGIDINPFAVQLARATMMIARKIAIDKQGLTESVLPEAISTQPWSGEAAVHISLINWCKKEPDVYHLDNQKVSQINSSLRSTTDVSCAVRLSANQNRCFQGVIPVGKGFLVTEQQVKAWLASDKSNQDVLKLFSMGANLAKNPHGLPDRWIIDFNNTSLEDASDYTLPFEHVKSTVKPERDNNRRDVRRINWWRFGENAPKMRKAIAPLSCYFAVPEVSKWAIFVPCPPDWLPGNKTKAVVSDDFYVLGLLLSSVHRVWMHVQKSTLKADIAYTHNTCFETFPFPQNPETELVKQIRATVHDLHNYRTEQMEKKQWGITQLYNKFFNEPSSQLYKLHAKLDQLVMQAYGFSPDDDILERLLALNLELAEKEKRGEPVVGAWASN